jgi:hypothetical protein
MKVMFGNNMSSITPIFLESPSESLNETSRVLNEYDELVAKGFPFNPHLVNTEIEELIINV